MNLTNYIIEKKKEEKKTTKEKLVLKLDICSASNLLQLAKKFSDTIKGYEPIYYCEELIITNNVTSEWKKWYEKNKNNEYDIYINNIAISDNYIAIKVTTDCKTENRDKVIFLSKRKGTKDINVKDINNWDRFGYNIILKGKIELKDGKSKK